MSFGLQDIDDDKLGSADFVGASGTVIDGPDLWLKQAGKEPIRIALSENSRAGLNVFLDDLRTDAVQCMIFSGDHPENINKFAHKNDIHANITDFVAMTGDIGCNQATPIINPSLEPLTA